MITDRINNWLNLYRQYFFTYQKGFFFLSYLANSPKLMIESSKKLPFMKYDNEKRTLYSDNPFVKGEFCYAELEEGLWVMNSKVKYKNNVSYTPVYDSKIPSNYYCITLNNIQNEFKKDFYEFDNFKIENESISFLKPKTDFINCHFKGSFENQYIVYFSFDWAEKNILDKADNTIFIADLFNNPEKGFVNYKFQKQIFQEITKKYQELFNNITKPDFLQLKINTYQFLNTFMLHLPELENLDITNLNYKERIVIEKIEKYLLGHLNEKFMGIEKIATHFNISPTKLKKDFKQTKGLSILQYFQKSQMNLAYQILKKDSLLIKDIAKMFQYENGSKFSKTFQKVHGFLPSKTE